MKKLITVLILLFTLIASGQTKPIIGDSIYIKGLVRAALIEAHYDGGDAQTTIIRVRNDSGSDQGATMTADIDFSLWDNNTRISTPQGRIGVLGSSTASQNAEAGGRLVFYTNIASNGSPVLTEAMRIDENQDVSMQEDLSVVGNITTAGIDDNSTTTAITTSGTGDVQVEEDLTVVGTTQAQRFFATNSNTAHTLVIGNRETVNAFDNSAAKTITIPTNASVSFALGTQITFINTGAGTLSFSTSGVTLLDNISGQTLAQYDRRTITKTATDTWVLSY